MKIAVSGSSGLVGRELCRLLSAEGHHVLRLVRKRSDDPREVYWDWEQGEIEAAKLENCDAVVHLAGENIAAHRWTEKQKNLILRSRVEGTGLLGKTLQGLHHPPSVFLSSSAVGYYGNRNSETLTESSTAGRGFLSEICLAWEAAAAATCPPQTRLVLLRFGVILGRSGGALQKMLLPFQLGLGGRIGSGRQYLSWISLPDTCRAILTCVENTAVSGPVNIVGPEPVTNTEFTGALAKALHRPSVFPLPAFAIRLLYGQLGQEALISGNRALPSKLLQHGFTFDHPTVEQAFAGVLSPGAAL